MNTNTVSLKIIKKIYIFLKYTEESKDFTCKRMIRFEFIAFNYLIILKRCKNMKLLRNWVLVPSVMSNKPKTSKQMR